MAANRRPARYAPAATGSPEKERANSNAMSALSSLSSTTSRTGSPITSSYRLPLATAVISKPELIQRFRGSPSPRCEAPAATASKSRRARARSMITAPLANDGARRSRRTCTTSKPNGRTKNPVSEPTKMERRTGCSCPAAKNRTATTLPSTRIATPTTMSGALRAKARARRLRFTREVYPTTERRAYQRGIDGSRYIAHN